MRKRFMGFVVVLTVLAMMLAACTGGKNTKTPETTTPQPQAQTPPKEKVFYGGWPYDVPPKSHWNVFVTGGLVMGGSPYNELMFNPMMMYYWDSGTWEPLLATEYKVDQTANTITLSLRKGVKFSDGSDFKAKDVLDTLTIRRAQSATVWRYLKAVVAKDDYTIEYQLSQPASIALRYILKDQPHPSTVYGEWAKKLQAQFDAGKAATSDEIKAIMKEMDAFRPANYVVSGAFVIDTATITEAQMTLKKVPTYWNANTIKFEKVVIYQGETAAVTPLILDKKIDFATHAFPVATEKQFVAQGIRIVRFPTNSGPALFFNNDIHPFELTEFRQAVAHAINRDENGAVALGQSGVGVKKMAGFSDNMVKNWVPEAVASKLNGYEYNTAKAEELLKKVGFKKGADGIWLDDKGKQVAFEIQAPSDFADWSASADNVVQQLNKFGFKTVLRGVPSSQAPTDINAGKFQVAYRLFGSSVPHPQFGFIADLVTYNAGGQLGNKEKPGQNYPLKTFKWSGGTVDIDKLITDSGAGMDLNKQKETIGKLTQMFNEQLPIVPLYERYYNSPVLEGTHVVGWPKDGDPILKNAGADFWVTLMILTGKLGPA